MIKNEYTKKISEIKAPQSAVDNAVKAALNAQKNRKEIIAVPKKSNKIIKIVSAAAACAVIASAVTLPHWNTAPPTAIPISSGTETSIKNSFSLIVNAAELTQENTVGISELNMSDVNNMGFESTSIELVEIDENTHQFRAVWYPTVNFPVVCKGNGIKSITYTINGAVFELNENVPFMEIALNETDSSMIEIYGKHICHSFTIGYDDQLKNEYIACIKLKPSNSPDIAKDDLTRQAQQYLEHIPYFDDFVDFKNGDKYPELKNALFKSEIQDVTVDITVSFTDGTNIQHSIAFIGKDNISPISMPIEATLINN